jgi:diadenosine tetraphosphate (Ap4A) HIT family hydrolase
MQLAGNIYHWFYPTKAEEADTVIEEMGNMRLVVPKIALSAGTLRVECKKRSRELMEDNNETFVLRQKVAAIWEQRGLDYMIYKKETLSDLSAWDIVPYPRTGWRFWNQFKALWRITFGGFAVPKVERERIANEFKDAENLSKIGGTWQSHPSKSDGQDPFCNSITDRQIVFKGQHVKILYDYRPIALGADKLHFLIVPIQHRLTFADLTLEEYQEIKKFENYLKLNYLANGHSVYQFSKNGAASGQTVSHWHQHMVFAQNETEAFLGKLTVLKNMLIGSSPLSNKELTERVESLKRALGDLKSE